MINELIKEYIASKEIHKITEAIGRTVGRRLIKERDRVTVAIVERKDLSGYDYACGVVSFEGEVYGLLEIDYSEPCLIFTPSSKLKI